MLFTDNKYIPGIQDVIMHIDINHMIIMIEWGCDIISKYQFLVKKMTKIQEIPMKITILIRGVRPGKRFLDESIRTGYHIFTKSFIYGNFHTFGGFVSV